MVLSILSFVYVCYLGEFLDSNTDHIDIELHHFETEVIISAMVLPTVSTSNETDGAVTKRTTQYCPLPFKMIEIVDGSNA